MTDLSDNESIFSASEHLTREQLIHYNLGQMDKEEQYLVEKHLVDCELCKDALSGMALIPHYEGIDKIRRDIRRLSKPKYDDINKIAWRIIGITTAVLALVILITLFYLYLIKKI